MANGIPKNVGLGKILTRSRNLGSIFDKSRSLVFAWFVFTFFESRNFLPKRVSASLGFYHSPPLNRHVHFVAWYVKGYTMTIEDTQKKENEKCHGPSHGPGGIHRSRRVPWDTFQRGNVDCYEIDYSVVPFTMRTKKLHVVQTK